MKYLTPDKRIYLKLWAAFATIGMIALLVLLFPSYTSLEESESENEIEEEDFISINHLLTNEMSDIDECISLDKYINNFMKRWEIKGASLAIMKDGKLVYSKGYGWADEEMGIHTDPGHIFRVASLSKLITAVAIMKLQEDSLLSLNDKVFGDGGILDLPQFKNIKDARMGKITVDHLLRHKGGFSLSRGDPMFTTKDIILREKMDTVPDMDMMIQYALTQRLGSNPGGTFRYSNLGYLILTKIIEVKSGMKYEDYCQKYILKPAGCYDMHLANNLYEERYKNEVRYYETHDSEPTEAFDNSGKLLWRRYGGSNIAGLLGAGAWVTSPSEFVRFVASIDDDDSIKDILSHNSIMEMISDDRPIGWVRAENGSDWVRTGTLAGTSAVVKRQKNGYIWMFVTNTSSWKGSRFSRYIERMFKDASYGISWPDRDLMNMVMSEQSVEAGKIM